MNYIERGGNPDNTEEWVSGYNFLLEKAALKDNTEDKIVMFEVVGISRNGNYMRVDFDAYTGEFLLAEENIVNSEGEEEWRNVESYK